MSVRLHVIRLPEGRTLQDLPPDEIPPWGDSAVDPIYSRLRENVLYVRLDPAFHCLLPHRPSERQSSLETHRPNMERFTSYLQQRENVGLDLEGTLSPNTARSSDIRATVRKFKVLPGNQREQRGRQRPMVF